MIDSCKQALAEFPTTIEEDQGILESMKTNSPSLLCSHARTAVEARLLEKQSWQALLNFFQREKARLSVKEYYQERRLKSLGLLDMDGNSTY
jgi:[ribulose-bisphosphate carboxylase]-lysine N-methyltransferase